MTRAEIRRKFDEIVAFAEVERFLDTPVKRYSRGMYVRLAFAVAAHLEPEILVVDEVLAVGDAEFQKKCLGKMDEVTRREGRTVLFVSHNMGTLTSLCTSAMLLEAGRVREIGAAGKVVQTYLNSSDDRERVEFPTDGDRPCITAVSVDARELRSGNFVATIEFTRRILEPADRRNRHREPGRNSGVGKQRQVSSERTRRGLDFMAH